MAENSASAPIGDILAERLPYWAGLSASQQQLLASSSRRATYQRGERIGGRDDCPGVMVLLQGSVRAYLLSDEGKEITLFRVNPNESCVLAATCALDMITFDLFLDAEEEVDLVSISSSAFSRVMEESLEVEAFTYRQTAERFSEVMWVMQQVLFMSFDARLAVFLLDEVARRGSDTLSITHDEIARHMGSAREVVSRMLKYFSDEGIVRLSRGKIEILDKAALRRLVS